MVFRLCCQNIRYNVYSTEIDCNEYNFNASRAVLESSQ